MKIHIIEDEKIFQKKLKLLVGVATLSGAIITSSHFTEPVHAQEHKTKEFHQIPNYIPTIENKSSNAINEIPIEASNKYWRYTQNVYYGFNAPENTSTSIWFLDTQRERTMLLNNSNTLYMPAWSQIQFDFQKVVGQIHYEDLTQTFFHVEDDSIKESLIIVPVYTSADRAIENIEPIQKGKFYLNFEGSTIGYPYQIIDNKLSQIEQLENIVYPAESLAFPLIRKDEQGNDKTIGYINGSYIVNILTSYDLIQEYDEEKGLLKQLWDTGKKYC